MFFPGLSMELKFCPWFRWGSQLELRPSPIGFSCNIACSEFSDVENPWSTRISAVVMPCAVACAKNPVHQVRNCSKHFAPFARFCNFLRARVLPFSLLKKVLRFSLFGNAVETANVTIRTPLADRLVWMRPGFYSRVSGITASSETASVDRIWVCCTKSCKYIVLIWLNIFLSFIWC